MSQKIIDRKLADDAMVGCVFNACVNFCKHSTRIRESVNVFVKLKLYMCLSFHNLVVGYLGQLLCPVKYYGNSEGYNEL